MKALAARLAGRVGAWVGAWACRVTGHPHHRRTVTGWTGTAVRAVCGRCGHVGILNSQDRMV